MYAATKQFNELLASAYCSEHGLKAVGLRFFTVYGPWGRPDMAVYKFTEAMIAGKPLKINVDSDSQSLRRDFTYIDDIVAGIMLTLDHTPCECGEVYNLAYGKPRSVLELVSLLEEHLGVEAILNYSLFSPAEMPVTFADISLSRSILNYEPQVPLSEGIKSFTDWYRRYKNVSSRDSVDFEIFTDIEEKRNAIFKQKTDSLNEAFRLRNSGLKEKYRKHAQENGIALPVLGDKKFTFHPGKDSEGATIIRAPGYPVELLQSWCERTEQCVAFNTRGELKNQLKPPHQWKNVSDEEGLYVSDVDVCAADLHSCDRHAICESEGASLYRCECKQNYVMLGRQCVEKYADGRVSESEQLWMISDKIDGLDWMTLSHDNKFVFFPGLDSPGGDYQVVTGSGVDGDFDKLMEVCRNTHHCLGFNTNGILKHSLQPPDKWVQWTTSQLHGLFVLDVDYCSLRREVCPDHSHCARVAPGNYTCVCDAGWTTTTRTTKTKPTLSGSGVALVCVPSKEEKEEEEIHILLSVDAEDLIGLGAVVSSLLSHTARADLLRFHIALAELGEEEVKEYLMCRGLWREGKVELATLEPDWLDGLVRVEASQDTVGHLSSLANFGRFHFPSLFPDLSHGLYFDADVVVRGDVVQLWNAVVQSNSLLTVVERDRPTYGEVFRPKTKLFFSERYSFTFGDDDPTFNAGVFGVNFDLWRALNIQEELKYWMKQHVDHPLWALGTQPLMLLVGYRKWEGLDPAWNVNGLGWEEGIHQSVLDKALVLHWSGKRKPWEEEGLYKREWLPHRPLVCSGAGTCVEGRCVCEDGSTGEHCERAAAASAN